MSKNKSVSDIIIQRPIFPNERSSYISATFEVRNWPVIIRAFGIDCDTVGHVEMGMNDPCGGWRWTPYTPHCDSVAILGCANTLVIGVPGWYRIVFRDRITGEPLDNLDDLLVTYTETDMPFTPMLGQHTGGSAQMACGSQVVITEDGDCMIITVDNVPYRICPGDQVACDPNGLGIVINGVVCPFPEQQEISASVENDCLTIVIDGESFTLCNTDSVTLVSLDTDGNYQATNPDGSVVSWKMTHVSANGDGTFTAEHQDGSTVTWTGTDTNDDSITTVSDLGDGQFQATNPDGSVVTWNGNDSITLVDALDDNLYRATNPDGSIVEWRGGEEAPDICASPEVPDMVTGDTVLLCRDGTSVRVGPDAFVQDICFNNTPDMGEVCGLGQQLVLWNDTSVPGGCLRLGRVNTATIPNFVSSPTDIWTHVPENTGGLAIPDDFPVPTSYYTRTDYTAAGGIDSTPYQAGWGNIREAAGLDDAIIQNSRFARIEGETPCSRTFDVVVSMTRASPPASFDDALAEQSSIIRRVRFTPIGGSQSPWLYHFTPGTGNLSTVGAMDALNLTNQHDQSLTIPAGAFEIGGVYIAGNTAPLRWAANTNLPNFAAQAPTVTMRPRVVG